MAFLCSYKQYNYAWIPIYHTVKMLLTECYGWSCCWSLTPCLSVDDWCMTGQLPWTCNQVKTPRDNDTIHCHLCQLVYLSLSQPWLQLAVAWWRPVRWPILIKTLLQAAASVADFYNNKHTCHSPSLQIWLSACLLISSNMACGVVLMVNCSLLGACLSRYQCERQTKTREWPMPARLRRVLVSQTTNAESRVTHMTGGDKRGQEEFSVVHQIWIL